MRGVPDTIHVDTVDGRCATIDTVAAADPGGHPFLRAAWYAGERDDAGIRTLVARRACGRPLVAIPTAPLGPAMLGARGVPGSYWPFRSVPVAPDAEPGELARLFRHRAASSTLGAIWRMGPVYAEDRGAERIVAAARAAGWTVLERSIGTSFLLHLGPAARGEWPSRSTRRRVTAYERRLAEAHGPVTVRHVRGGEWSAEVVETLRSIEADSWVCRDTDRSGAKFADPALRRRWIAKLADPVIASALSATILSVGDTPIAYSFDLTAGTRQYGLATGYREDYADFRPGRIVTIHQLLAAAKAGVIDVDLGLGDSGYKQEMGAVRGSRMVDYLFVRSGMTAAVLAHRWRDPPAGERRAWVRPAAPWLAGAIATASAVAFMAD